MSLSPQFLDELRARTSLSALIGRNVKLIRAGREWKACCPFHQEKTPSFTVNDEKGFYHCFGCSAHGDAIRFLTEVRGLPFMDAVKELVDAAGMQLPPPDPRAREKADRVAGLHEVMEEAARWFQDQLAGIGGGAARDYLKQRGLSDATIAKFGFGFAPASRAKLRTALRRFGNDRLIEAGLLIEPAEREQGEHREPYDRFRGRLMIPIHDQRGRVIAFGGRILDEDQSSSSGSGQAKYLNSPDTPLFDKGRVLFNLDKAAPATRDPKRVIVVEGYMDVIALDQAGIGEAVAPLGTAVTEGQLERLWRLAPSPILCFDGDAAGQKAATRAAFRALPHVAADRSLAFATLPAGQDPDDLIRAGGREALETVLANAEPLVDRLWRHESSVGLLVTPEQRAGLRRRLVGHISAIGDPDVRDQYRAELLGRFNAFTRLRPPPRIKSGSPRGDRFFPPGRASDRVKAVGSAGLSAHTARAVLAGLLQYPELIAAHSEVIAALPLVDRTAIGLRDALVEAALTHGELDQERLNTILLHSAAPLAETLRSERGLAFSFTRRDADPERARRDLVLAIDTLAAQPRLDAALEAATARLKEEGDEAAFAEQQRLRAVRDEADRRLAALIDGGLG